MRGGNHASNLNNSKYAHRSMQILSIMLLNIYGNIKRNHMNNDRWNLSKEGSRKCFTELFFDLFKIKALKQDEPKGTVHFS